MGLTCEADDTVDACPTPVPGTDAGQYLQRARDEADFSVLYPCYLPNSQRLRSSAITGAPGRQLVELAWDGPFDMVIRQAQFPPAPVAATVGASRRTIDLFPNTRATFIEINDGSAHAQYYLLWSQNGIYYELQAVGPPLQQNAILRIARSLQ
jgi:hypothetical protein